MVFDRIQVAVADALGTSVENAGYLLGFLAILLVEIAASAAIGKDTKVLLLLGLGGAAFAVLIKWWPIWTVVLIVIALAVLLLRPFGGDSD